MTVMEVLALLALIISLLQLIIAVIFDTMNITIQLTALFLRNK